MVSYMWLLFTAAQSAPSRHLNHWWHFVRWTHGNKLQWTLYKNANIVFQEKYRIYRLQNGGHLSKGECVNLSHRMSMSVAWETITWTIFSEIKLYRLKDSFYLSRKVEGGIVVTCVRPSVCLSIRSYDLACPYHQMKTLPLSIYIYRKLVMMLTLSKMIENVMFPHCWIGLRKKIIGNQTFKIF